MSQKRKMFRNMITIFALLVGLLLGSRLFQNRKKSTSKLARLHGLNILDFIHGYIYFKWTSLYLRPVKYVLERPGRFPKWLYEAAGNRLMQAHHAKVITNETAKRLVDVKEPIKVSNPEQVVPFERARDIILENSEHIAVVDCPCRQLAENPCGPLDVCFVLGEPVVDFVLEHKPAEARKLDVREALDILQHEHERGRVHTAWFKDVAGNRLYSICNCCGCCCLGLRALSFGFGLVASSGYVAQVDTETCMLCGVCEDACQFRAIDVLGDVWVDKDKCKGCGVCAQTCPAGAISLQEDAAKPGPLVLP